MKGRVGQLTLEVEGSGAMRDLRTSERARFCAETVSKRRDFGASGNVIWDR